MALLEKRRFSGVAEQERRAAAVGSLPHHPLCRSTRCETRERMEKQYIAGEHQAYESMAG